MLESIINHITTLQPFRRKTRLFCDVSNNDSIAWTCSSWLIENSFNGQYDECWWNFPDTIFWYCCMQYRQWILSASCIGHLVISSYYEWLWKRSPFWFDFKRIRWWWYRYIECTIHNTTTIIDGIHINSSNL